MLIANNHVCLENVGDYKDVITVKTVVNGIVKIREISRAEIKAYGKSLKEYAAKNKSISAQKKNPSLLQEGFF